VAREPGGGGSPGAVHGGWCRRWSARCPPAGCLQLCWHLAVATCARRSRLRRQPPAAGWTTSSAADGPTALRQTGTANGTTPRHGISWAAGKHAGMTARSTPEAPGVSPQARWSITPPPPTRHGATTDRRPRAHARPGQLLCGAAAAARSPPVRDELGPQEKHTRAAGRARAERMLGGWVGKRLAAEAAGSSSSSR
jgi:hypothetical protein